MHGDITLKGHSKQLAWYLLGVHQQLSVIHVKPICPLVAASRHCRHLIFAYSHTCSQATPEPFLMHLSRAPLLAPTVPFRVQPFRGGFQWRGGWRWPHVPLASLLSLLPPAAPSAPDGELCTQLPACEPRPVERGGSLTVYLLSTRLDDLWSKILIMIASGPSSCVISLCYYVSISLLVKSLVSPS